MKCVMSFVLGMVSLSLFSARLSADYIRNAANGADVKIYLMIKDDQGCSVEDAAIRASFSRGGRKAVVTATTDGNGLCTLEHRTCGNAIEISVCKEGYYKSKKTICLIKMNEEHDIKDGKWQPWPIPVALELRKIRNPISLNGCVRILPLQKTNEWIGVDMKVGDFVSPLGTGTVSDFEMCVQWDGLPDLTSVLCLADVRFPLPFTGGYFLPKVNDSMFPYPYFADTNVTYTSTFKVQNRNGEFYSTHRPFNKNAVFVTRTRCVLDEKGDLKSANYGCLRRVDVSPGSDGKSVCVVLNTIFNSVSDDVNLEPKK